MKLLFKGTTNKNSHKTTYLKPFFLENPLERLGRKTKTPKLLGFWIFFSTRHRFPCSNGFLKVGICDTTIWGALVFFDVFWDGKGWDGIWEKNNSEIDHLPIGSMVYYGIFHQRIHHKNQAFHGSVNIPWAWENGKIKMTQYIYIYIYGCFQK